MAATSFSGNDNYDHDDNDDDDILQILNLYGKMLTSLNSPLHSCSFTSPIQVLYIALSVSISLSVCINQSESVTWSCSRSALQSVTETN